MAIFVVLLCIGVSIRISQSSTCHAQCDYDHVTARVDCSSRNLSCIPVNYPDSLVMDLSHNDISVLEPDDFSGTFTRLVELYLDYNNISDVTSLLDATGLGSLQRLSLQHNVISALQFSCSLNSLINISLDYNFLSGSFSFPRCTALEYLSANFNLVNGFSYYNLISAISLQFNEISSFRVTSTDVSTLLLDNNKIHRFSFTGNTLNLVSLSHNKLTTLTLTVLSLYELNIANNEFKDIQSVDVRQSGGNNLKKLDISSNSFDSLIQPDWAEGLQILHADDNILANLSSTTLQGFSSLTELHLANNRLVFISTTALSQLTKLRSLYLDGNALTSFLGGVFLNQTDLVEISITNNQLSELHPDSFLGLDSLERLYLAGNRLVYAHSELFRQMPDLTTMDVSNNELEVFDIRNCSRLRNLTNLMLANNSISNISLILGHCENLVVLDLSFNQIQVVPCESLKEGNRALSRLELEGNPLHCDCQSKFLWHWLRINPPSVRPRCQTFSFGEYI
ncbi:leucine-rich repeats and immunoglobulin-like domains protein 2 [Patiria miniata]|uniref:Uncharacterized protein n=1 Tax=Patiria miniata TaxID=46514 RepID=A0A914AUJ5_PATMI|nr:leucine-rich repeats and immunoglobulin-like domains protein 2 [Patiria miniata]